MVNLIAFIILFFILLVFSLPLHFFVKILGGKTTVLKTLVTLILAGIVVTAIHIFFTRWAGIIAFIAVLWLYREIFRLKWLKAFFVWFLSGLVLIIVQIVLTYGTF
jgi:hypothetical protein